MEQVEKVQENSQSCWHLIEKKDLQLAKLARLAKRDKLQEKKDDIGEIIYDFQMFKEGANSDIRKKIYG